MDAFSWAILTACIWGVVPILEKIGLAHISPTVALFYRCLGVVLGLVLLPLFAVKLDEVRSVDFRSIIFLVTAGFLASFLAQITFYNGLKLGDVSKIVPISASYPLITFILGLIIFKENFSIMKALGVLSVVVGIWAIKIG